MFEFEAEGREVLRGINGLEKLIEFINNAQFKDMHVNCLNLLSNCLEDPLYLDVCTNLSVFNLNSVLIIQK